MKKPFSLLVFCLFVLNSFSQIYQWRGPDRTGMFNETNLLKEWPEAGPSLTMEIEGIGKGWSSPVVTGDRVFVSGMIDSIDYLSCIDFEGNILWQKPYGSSWAKSFPDTRGSATIEDNRVYILSGQGNLVCFEYATGEKIWEVNVDKDFNSEWHSWGVSESILIVDDKVICTPGGQETSVVAFDKMTGELVWKSQSTGGPRAYASPTIYEWNGFRYILAVTGRYLHALLPETGEIVWKYKYFDDTKWTFQPGLIWTNTPVFSENQIWISKGYNYPSVMLVMDSSGQSVKEKFVDQTFDNHHHGQILVDGHLYGSNWLSNGKGKWVCMNWDRGEITWVEDWNNKGSIIFADGLFYLYEERKGNVALVRPDKEKFDLISSFVIEKGSGPHWSHPYIAHGKLWLRHGEWMGVYDIAAK
jgi:outer membrane protein assembly factor BamB